MKEPFTIETFWTTNLLTWWAGQPRRTWRPHPLQSRCGQEVNQNSQRWSSWAFFSIRCLVRKIDHTAKTKCRKFKTNIPRKGISIGASVQIYTFMCLWTNYLFPRSVCLFCWRKYVDRSWEYISRSETHECGNWGWGRAVPRKGIYKRNCRCSAVEACHFIKDLNRLPFNYGSMVE
jgi:hypothetical protein